MTADMSNVSLPLLIAFSSYFRINLCNQHSLSFPLECITFTTLSVRVCSRVFAFVRVFSRLFAFVRAWRLALTMA